MLGNTIVVIFIPTLSWALRARLIRKRFGDEQPIDNHNNDTELFFKISVALDVQYRYRRRVKTKLTVFVCSGLAPKGALCGYINKKSRKYYSHLHNSVNTEISFFGRDVTYLPKKDISHVLMAMLMALDNDTQQWYSWHLHYPTIWSDVPMAAWYFAEGVTRLRSIRLVSKVTKKSCTVSENMVK